MIVDVVDINSDCGKLRITIHCISDDAGASTGSKSEIALSENSQGKSRQRLRVVAYGPPNHSIASSRP